MSEELLRTVDRMLKDALKREEWRRKFPKAHRYLDSLSICIKHEGYEEYANNKLRLVHRAVGTSVRTTLFEEGKKVCRQVDNNSNDFNKSKHFNLLRIYERYPFYRYFVTKLIEDAERV